MKKIPTILDFLNKPSRLLVFFGISSLVLRLAPWKYIIVNWGESAFYTQPDAYYHLRRATIWAYNFPRLINLDYYMAYPYGAECPWSPLYDFFITLLSLIIGGGSVKHEILRVLIAIMPPVIAALCIWPTYKLAKLMWENERIAIFSAFLAIAMPGMLGYSHVGSGDHHIAETFFSLWFFYFGVSAVKKAVENTKYIGTALSAGIMMAMGLLVWQGQIVFFTVFCAYAAWVIIFRKFEKEAIKNVASACFIMGLVTASIAGLVRFILPRATEQTKFEFVFFSYFQPLYILVVSIVIISLFFLITKVSWERLFTKANIIKFFIASAVLIALILFIVPLRNGIIAGIKFLLRDDPWFASINEFQPLFTFAMIRIPTDISSLMEMLYLTSIIFPFIYGFIIIKKFFFRPQERPWNELFFFFWAVIIGFFALYQRRWNNAYSPALAIGIALFINTVYVRIKSGHGLFREFLKWKEEYKGQRTGILSRFFAFYDKSPFLVSAAIILFFLVPYYNITKDTISAEGYPIPEDLYKTMLWIKEYTPKTSYLWTPDKKPEYGIIAPWDHGHYIQYIAERPTITNNFGHALRGDGFKDAIYIWSCESEKEVVKITEKYNAKFLLLTDPVPFLSNPITDYLKPGFSSKYLVFKEAHYGAMMQFPTEDFFSLPMSAMVEFDGSATSYGPALKHFRLIFESQSPNQMPYHLTEVKAYKLFEYVKGAHIKGKAEPNTVVYFQSRFMSNWDREFEWRAAAFTDAAGNFEGVVPYATTEDNYFIIPLMPYMVINNNKYVSVNVSNADIIEGKQLRVDVSKGKILPREMQKTMKEKAEENAGKLKSKSYVNIHTKK